jgi:hypothetical protein
MEQWMARVREETRRDGELSQLAVQNPELLLLDVPTVTPEVARRTT